MNAQLLIDITTALENTYHAKAQGNYLSKIECSDCGRREAFTSKSNPWVVQCGRANKCGSSHHVKDLFPHLFETWTERYGPKTDAEKQKYPNAVADAYLKDGRGFDLIKITGWYTQEYYFDESINAGTTTVRFKITEKCFTERLLDKPQRFGKQKSRTVGPYKGQVWVPNVYTLQDLADAKEIWIVEGIFDAIALHHVGIIAVSNISSGNYPSYFLEALAKQCPQGKRPTLIWAQDSDKAGQKAILKHKHRAQKDKWKNGAAQIPKRNNSKDLDWNDLLQLGKFEDYHIDQYLHEGDLLLAANPSEKAILMYEHRSRREFWFTFDSQIWWWHLDLDAYDKELRSHESSIDDAAGLSSEKRHEILRSAGAVRMVCSVLPTPLYYQQNKITGESWYYYSIESAEGNYTIKDTFTAKQLTSPGEFKNRLLHIAKGALWLGKPNQLDIINHAQWQGLKTVETIDFVGYSKVHQAYIYNDIAIKNGAVTKINDQDYFQFSNLAVKSLSSSIALNINPNLVEYQKNFASKVATAFGNNGVIAMAWFLGSLFAEQIRASQKSYPFMEIVGEAGAGKTTLIEFLWKTLGRDDEEGFDPSKATNAARYRKFSQVSNMPVSLIESDRETDTSKGKQFDWDELKTAFNGRAIASRGVKNNGNDTYEPPFKGAVLISQNAAVDGGEAILSRIVHLHLLRDAQTTQSKAAANWLGQCDVEAVSGFLISATKAEKAILNHLDNNFRHYYQHIMKIGDVRMARIAENHAQLMSLVDCLGDQVLGLLNDDAVNNAKSFLVEMAACRQSAINSDHPIVQDFWENFEFIAAHNDVFINHTPHREYISINLKEYEHWCNTFKIYGPDIRELKRYLKGSKHCKFRAANVNTRSEVATKANSSDSKQLRCWQFDNPKR